MKTKYLAFAALCGAVVFGVTACGDDVINIKNDDVYSIVDTLDSAACTKDAEGNMSLVKESGEMYVCSNGEWKNIAGSDAINLRCSSELLKDSSGYMIICDGDTIGTVYNNNTTSISDRFKQAVIDSLEKVLKASADSLKKEQQAAIDAKINELKDKDSSDNLACQIADTKIDSEKSIQTVEIKCGDNTSTLELPIYQETKGNSKSYQKHVVVRFPVQTQKNSNSAEIYEEIWSHLTSGNYSELTIMDLDSNLNQTGKLFVSDLIASNPKSFVTVEVLEPADKTKDNVVTKKVEYSVARLEGDLDVTNLVNSIVQLRVKLNLSANMASSDIVYNAIIDLDDEGDIVIDFLTDYKAARVKELVKAGDKLSAASKKANGELADALALSKDAENYPAFETYLPDSIELNEHVNGLVWVMALFDQADLSNNVNKVYADYRDVFAKNGNFNTAIQESFNGKEQSLFFVDYLSLLINANFDKWEECEGNMWNCGYEYTGYSAGDDVMYKILQKGYKDAYKLPESDKDEIVMTEVDGGLFKFFEHDKNKKIWKPVSLEMLKEYSDYYVQRIVPLVDSTAVCKQEGTDVGNKVSFMLGGEEVVLVCLSKSSMEWRFYEDSTSSFDYSSSSSSLSEDDMLDLKLGQCDETVMKKAEIRDVDYCEMHLATTTCTRQFKCDHIVTSTGRDYYKWIKADSLDIKFKKTCVEGLVDEIQKVGETHYICRETSANSSSSHTWGSENYNEFKGEERCTSKRNGEIITLEEDGVNNSYTCKWVNSRNDSRWMETEVTDYCQDNVKINGTVKNNISATQKIDDDEDLGAKTYDQKCKFNDTLYVRNSTGTRPEWKTAWQYIILVYGDVRGTLSEGYYTFMDGYKEHEVYVCAKHNGYIDCTESSEDAVRGLNTVEAVANPVTQIKAQDQRNLLANMTIYEKTDDYGDDVAYATDVLLPGATAKTTLLASAARNDWRKPTIEEIAGECNLAKVDAQAEFTRVDGISYECDCAVIRNSLGQITDNGCKWNQVPADEVEYGLCTISSFNANGPSYADNGKRICKSQTVEVGNSSTSTSYEWFESDADEQKQYGFWWCDKNNGWKFLNGVTKKLKAGDETPGYNYAGTYAICDNVPEDITTYILTYSLCGSSRANYVDEWTADEYYGNWGYDCGSSPDLIMSRLSNSTYTVDGKPVHDFICKDGKLREAKDEQEACNAAYTKTQVCTFTKNDYVHNDSKWIPLDINEYCNNNGKNVSWVQVYDEETGDPQGGRYDNDDLNNAYFWRCMEGDDEVGYGIVKYCNVKNRYNVYKTDANGEWIVDDDSCH